MRFVSMYRKLIVLFLLALMCFKAQAIPCQNYIFTCHDCPFSHFSCFFYDARVYRGGYIYEGTRCSFDDTGCGIATCFPKRVEFVTVCTDDDGETIYLFYDFNVCCGP